MSIEEEVNERLKDAMRAKDRDVLDALRNYKGEVQKAATAEGFSGDVDDDLYRSVLATYVKRLEKTLPTYEAAGDRGAETAAKLRFEIGYLSEWLPQKLDEDATADLVDQALAETGVTDPKKSGQVIGHVMRSHRDVVDPAIVRRLIEERLRG